MRHLIKIALIASFLGVGTASLAACSEPYDHRCLTDQYQNDEWCRRHRGID